MIDLRSDTVTLPTPAMRAAMARADVGDDVYGDDPSVNRLQALAADMCGFENALFVASGTQANLIALMTHCGRGDEYICGQQAHNYMFEGGGAAVLGSIQPQPLTNQSDGSILLADIQSAIKPKDIHFAQTKLLSLENTIGGKVLSTSYLASAQKLAFKHRLRTHLDGARVANAAVAQNVSLADICQYFDSVSICLSKGLCAPVGSILLGDEQFIEKAKRWRKMLGGGMRQAGVIAAAGELALTQQVERLADDHYHAQLLATELSQVAGLSVELSRVQTNMVFVRLDDQHEPQTMADALLAQGIKIYPGRDIRLVLHKDIHRRDIRTIVDGFKSCLATS